MKITLTKTGKRFNSDWIFRNLDFEFNSNNQYAVVGANGSGKSTLLQLIAGNITPSEGEINYQYGDKIIAPDNIFRYLTLATPYQQLIEEFTLPEMLHFHQKFKPFVKQFTPDQICEMLAFPKSESRQLQYYSSGMKQRVKLALAILSDTPLLLLDEPCTNLDRKGTDWYHHLINDYSDDRLIIVCSNHKQEETALCKYFLSMEDYKKSIV
jgi:ABC-type multidrug transport system ATPase subunit